MNLFGSHELFKRLLLAAVLIVAVNLSAWDGGVTYRDVAPEAGIDYARMPSQRNEAWQDLKEAETIDDQAVMVEMPVKGRGAPGVAVLDYDKDGDLDIYVTNGPGTPNSLYSNQLMETGVVSFVDMAVSAGVDALNQDSSGVCYGDIDNDGDHDLYVLGSGMDNILYLNNGDGTFTDITAEAGVGGEGRWAAVAAMGDVNNDGLLDIYVGNAGDMSSFRIIMVEHFALNEHNQLFLNMGDGTFQDISATSGIENLNGFAPENAGNAGITWAVAMVDYDQDGDVDIFSADDQAAFLEAARGGIDRGLIHVYENDGGGNFTDINVDLGLTQAGAYMGLSFGDYNADGFMDFFASNLGTYNLTNFDPLTNYAVNGCKWYLGGAAGFAAPPLSEAGETTFGWGTSSFDYDNDGDVDILYHGGLDLGGFVMCSNPGSIMQNDGNAHFTYDTEALANSGADHIRRTVHGVATGDLDRDGFTDMVSVSNFNFAPEIELTPFDHRQSSYDDLARFIYTVEPGEEFGSQVYRRDLIFPPAGTLAVELADNTNGNHWIDVRVLGAKGVTRAGRVNRDGIGAVVYVTPEGGHTVMRPVAGGSSHASQDALNMVFGLGQASTATVEVLWPGGARTMVTDVKAGSHLVVPEMPVSVNDPNLSAHQYFAQVNRQLREAYLAGEMDYASFCDVLKSVYRAYWEAHP